MKLDHQNILLYAGALTPAVVVLAMRFFGQAPAVIYANTEEVVDWQKIGIPDVSLSNQEPALSYEGIIDSPFGFEPDPFDMVNPFAHLEPQDSNQPADITLDVTVSTILPNPRNPLAVINGKACQVGDSLGRGWTLTSIDGNARTITMTHTSGKSETIGLTNDHHNQLTQPLIRP